MKILKIVLENTYRLNAATLSLKYSQVKNKINLENKKIQGRLLSQSLHYCFFSVCVMSRYMFNQIHICFRVLRFQLEKNFRMLHTYGFLIFDFLCFMFFRTIVHFLLIYVQNSKLLAILTNCKFNNTFLQTLSIFRLIF